MIVKNDTLRSASVIVLASLLSACGGGSSGGASSTGSLSGVFVDAPVTGIAYSTSSGISGTTNTEGQFNYAKGDTVTFSVGSLSLGSTMPSAALSGSTTVTPVDLVPGATGTSDPGVTAIGQLLGTLNSIAVANNAGAGGVFTMPSNAASLVAGLGTTTATTITTSQLQSMVTSAGVGSVTTSADAQANLNQGVNASNVIGTTWSAVCTCGGGGTFFFEPNGALTGFTSDGSLLAGSWSGSSTVSGNVNISLISSGGGYTQNGTVTGSTGAADLYGSNNSIQGTLAFTKLAASAALTNTLYLGGWYATYTPNATGIAAGDTGGHGYFILSPDGTFSGITDGKNQTITGTWDPSTGIGSGTLSNDPSGPNTFGVNVATKTASFSVSGVVHGTLTFSRTGSLTMQSGSSSGNQIPLLLNITVSWPANIGNVVSSFALSLDVKDSSGNLIASGIKSEVNPMGAGAIANTTTDNIAVPYPQGSAASYSLSVGPSNCSIVGSSGTVVDANNNNAGAYPTVAITCN